MSTAPRDRRVELGDELVHEALIRAPGERVEDLRDEAHGADSYFVMRPTMRAMTNAAGTQTIVFLHGAWVTPSSWEPFIAFFEAKGYRCIAPAWPGKDRTIEAIRTDPSLLAGLGIGEIVDHYERIIRALDEPPILIGHSFGGLFTQILLDRGVGAAGVAIDSAPPRGVLAFEPTAIRALASVLFTWRGWRKVVRWTYSKFRYAFVHTLPEGEARAAYETHATPETGRIFFQGALAGFDRHSPASVNFGNATRAPLLLVAGAQDRIVQAAVVRRNYRKYANSSAVTDFKEFPGRTHWLIAQAGWEEVAEHISEWLARVPLQRHAKDPEASHPNERPGAQEPPNNVLTTLRELTSSRMETAPRPRPV